MTSRQDALGDIVPDQDALTEKFATSGLMSKDEADALAHAIVDVAETIRNVYGKLLPRIAESKDEQLKEALWELRDEFRHVDYHIHDGILRGRE